MLLDLAIIGAGISGLAAAQVVRASGKSVAVFDKGRAPGGRIATRRIGAAVFDHGAQFFTVRDDAFATTVLQWQASGVVAPWCHGFPSSDGEATGEDGHVRYFCPNGMIGIVKHLSSDLPPDSILVDHKITKISHEGDHWCIDVENRPTVRAKAVLVTAPAPQVPAFFSDDALAESCRMIAHDVQFDPCLALMILAGPSEAAASFPAPGGRRFDSPVLSWGADNHCKGISPVAGSVTLHGCTEFSRVNFAADDLLVAREMVVAAGLSTATLGDPTRWQLKRWRYAIPANPHPDRYRQISSSPLAVLAGDAFGGPRIEGAWLSGVAAGKFLTR